MRDYLMVPFTKYSKKKSPAGLFNDPFYKIFQKKPERATNPKRSLLVPLICWDWCGFKDVFSPFFEHNKITLIYY